MQKKRRTSDEAAADKENLRVASEAADERVSPSIAAVMPPPPTSTIVRDHIDSIIDQCSRLPTLADYESDMSTAHAYKVSESERSARMQTIVIF